MVGEAQRPWVIFDLDGTLLDYRRAESEAVTLALRALGLEVTSPVLERYREVNARHWAALEQGETTPSRLRLDRWRELLVELDAAGVCHLDVAAVDLPALAERYVRHLADGAYLEPGATEVVATLSATHGIAMVTNGLADVQRPRLAASPLAEAAEVLVISDEVGAAKPDPAIFEVAWEAMGRPPREAVTMVGDSLTSDIAGGRAYGLATVWIAPGHQPLPEDPALRPDHRIAALTELPAVLGV